MKGLTKEQMKFLEKYEPLLHSAYYSHTVIGARIDQLNELMDFYVKLGYRKQSVTCNFCVIGFLSTLGGLYYNRQKQVIATEVKKNKEKETKEQPTEEPKEQPVEEPTEVKETKDKNISEE